MLSLHSWRKLHSVCHLVLGSLLLPSLAAQAEQELKFRRHELNPDSTFSACAAIDVNHDGRLDVVCGGFWYEAPDWKRHFVRNVEMIRGRYDGYSHLPLDVNGDGWTDLIHVNHRSASIYWLEHPGESLGRWEKRMIAEPGSMETGRLVDVDGDGKLDLLPNGVRFAAWWELTDAGKSGSPVWLRHDVPSEIAGHGVGFGDLNGDGRGDLVGAQGWLEAPADPRHGSWTWHPEFTLSRDTSVPVIVADVEGDGDNDLIWGRGHDYGLYWLEQSRQHDQRTWTRHVIDESWSQGHSPLWVDLDNDGQHELVSGKRYMAHEGRDPGAGDPLVIYWYKFNRAEGRWERGVVEESGPAGFGLDPKAVDLDADGDLDLVTPGRSGLYWFENLLADAAAPAQVALTAIQEQPFGPDFPNLDSDATGQWWEERDGQPPRLMVDRDDVLAFALYTHDRGVLKLTAQLYPLLPQESRRVRLELYRDGGWREVAAEDVVELGWSAHFRIQDWDSTQNVRYRLRHGERASFEGLIRRDPIDKDVIVVGSLSCNSRRTPGPRPRIIENLRRQDPDLLFFAGDQSYHHTQHTFGWLEFGLQFRDVLKDRPVITIPDDHDVGQGNIWGENGKRAATPAGPGGGFYYPAAFVNMVQRCQTWHLPDPFDPTLIERGIGVYYTNLRVGGIDFAILEDRKFKSGPEGKIPRLGPRPDHINDPAYDRKSVDLPGLKLLGDRQLKFLDAWSQNWEGAQMKAVLSQTAFCGAVHLHGSPDNRLLADLDSNGWPQTGRRLALAAMRRAWAPHLCGDQHLAVVVKHGIASAGDGPYGFTSPAIINTIYGRWWHPADEKPGPHAVADSPLPWTGDYEDGLGNLIRMLAYANPEDRTDELKRADGYGIARFDKRRRTITFECWPRFADVRDGDQAQFPGWPITVQTQDNDGRQPTGWLPELSFEGEQSAVVQVVSEQTGEVLYTVRSGATFRPPVYAEGKYTVKIGRDRPDLLTIEGVEPGPRSDTTVRRVRLAE